MRKIYLAAFLIVSSIGIAIAQTTIVTNDASAVVWTSKNSTELVTINNGSGNVLTVTITVDKNPNSPPSNSGSGSGSVPSSPGINVNNCGETKHIDAGSSGVCTSKDKANPISFSSDSNVDKATGTYTIR